MKSDTFRKLAALGLSHEQMAGVLEAFEGEMSERDAAEEERKAKGRERWRKWKNSQDTNVSKREQTLANSSKRLTRVEDNNKTNTTHEDISSLRSDNCSEPENPPPTSPTVIELPATQNEIVAITEADVAEWASAFPAVDVRQKLKAIRQWLIANPQKRKTPRGMKRFVVSWLSREQDRGGSRPTGPPQPQKSAHRQHQEDVKHELEKFLGINRHDDEFASNGPAFDLEPGNWEPH